MCIEINYPTMKVHLSLCFSFKIKSFVLNFEHDLKSYSFLRGKKSSSLMYVNKALLSFKCLTSGLFLIKDAKSLHEGVLAF